MTWLCKVCQKPAVQLIEIPTSKASKNGSYTLYAMAHCAEHLPIITNLDDGSAEAEQIQKRSEPEEAADD